MYRYTGLELFVLLLAAVALSVGQPARPPHQESGHQPGTAVREDGQAKHHVEGAVAGLAERVLRPGDTQDNRGGYSRLVLDRGTIYAGTVLSVTVKSVELLDPIDTGREERGTLRFRVDRTV